MTMSAPVQCAATVAGVPTRVFMLDGIEIAFRLSRTVWFDGYLPIDPSGVYLYRMIDGVSITMILWSSVHSQRPDFYQEAARHSVASEADTVAQAVANCAMDHGSSVYCHWFRLFAASSMRHGFSGHVQNNGGLRAARTAVGYLSTDLTSPFWLRDETILVPSVFVPYHGYELEKTPLTRASQPMPIQGTRLPKLLGYDTTGIQANIGLEQDFSFVPCDAHMKRPDLQMVGRIVIGKDAPRAINVISDFIISYQSYPETRR